MVFENGKLERKGKLFQETSPLKNHLPIINEALIKYLTEQIPIEETINNCNDLIKFQSVVKIGSTYDHCLWGDKKMSEKVIRWFASTKEEDRGLFKVKYEIKNDTIRESIQKIADTTDHVFIDNDNIIGKTCPIYLDKQYYINYLQNKLNTWGL